MPEINRSLEHVGIGFAAFLAPPGPEVIRFTVGQPDFDTPKPVVDEVKAALDRGETAYTRTQGSVELCEAVAKHLSKHNIAAVPDDVLVTPGCKQAVLYSLMATLDAGDEVLLLSPAWPSYDGMLKLLDCVPVHVPVKRDNYHPDFDALEAAVSSKTKAILLNSPNNPTGAVYNPEEIQRIVDFAIKHDLWILDDMIYATLVWTDYPYTSPASLEGGAERTITIGGWSKGWAMTGWRLGWITGPKRVMDGVKKINVSAATHVATFMMPAATVALSLETETAMMAASFKERRGLMHSLLSELPGVVVPKPEGAFYAFCDITGTGMDDLEFATRALEEANVQLIPGSLIEGGEGFVRISYATSTEDIHEGVRRLNEWLNSL
ncbi:MAG: pyridoxal phosphate-dependent aminotransferase [Euryarchaeota archaeon]|jgi:aspartate aminotransferase|nr:pyridoxal phosphate-dependent aminotransferase [Euryarchaeota archaeon]MBT6255142.1 pyridoxal phosphate-dependent aminotransferase [Euryarchaeota archaeon]